MPCLVYNIATRYLEHGGCVRMTDGYEKRLKFITDAFTYYGVRGIIFEKLKFCILYDAESFIFKKECEKNNFPFLVLDREYTDKSEGQIKTRIQAFLEMLKYQ